MNDDEKSDLLKLSRSVIEGKLVRRPHFVPTLTDALKVPSNVFVTLKKEGHLRGCIGNVGVQYPLWDAVVQMSLSAAFSDPRFPAVDRSELSLIKIEISILSPFEKVEAMEDFQIGTHGLVIRCLDRSGLFLPQVPIKWGWDKFTYLNELCKKAFLPPDAWSYPNASLQKFTTEIFSE